MNAVAHVPVLLTEAISLLAPHSSGVYVDATVGAAGHATAILERSSPDGRLLGIDADPKAIALVLERLTPFGARVALANAYFDDIDGLARWNGFVPADGILMDLGLSSLQIDEEERGFSFRSQAPLDMRFSPLQSTTAADLVNTLPERELADLIFTLGEEPRSRAIARAIVAARGRRSIVSATELAQIVGSAARRPGSRIHPATRTFQALRIAVNQELERLATALPRAFDILKPGGRLVVISFHSLEDRIVKQFFVSQVRGCVCPPEIPVCVCGRQPVARRVTPKAVRPSADEIAANPRSRSARLRAIEKLESA